MELTNEFSVGVPVDEAWAVLTDLERIAPCMPGAELQEVDGEEYRGVVKVKVGPMTAQYKGVASFQQRDEANHRVVVRAEARDTRGQGTASAMVTATLEAQDGGTHVSVHTDLSITGKVAQFGRGMLADVSSKLLRQFVEALEADVLRGAAATGTGPSRAAEACSGDEPPTPTRPAGPRRIESTPSEPVDLLSAAGPSLARRIGPLVLLVAVVLFLGLWLLRGC